MFYYTNFGPLHIPTLEQRTSFTKSARQAVMEIAGGYYQTHITHAPLNPTFVKISFVLKKSTKNELYAAAEYWLQHNQGPKQISNLWRVPIASDKNWQVNKAQLQSVDIKQPNHISRKSLKIELNFILMADCWHESALIVNERAFNFETATNTDVFLENGTGLCSTVQFSLNVLSGHIGQIIISPIDNSKNFKYRCVEELLGAGDSILIDGETQEVVRNLVKADFSKVTQEFFKATASSAWLPIYPRGSSLKVSLWGSSHGTTGNFKFTYQKAFA